MFFFSKSNLKLLKFVTIILIINISLVEKTFSDDKNLKIENIYKLLQDKEFEKSIEKLNILSKSNNIKAQLLYSKILLSGDITPQNFEKSYFWASVSLLGGLKKSTIVIEKLNKYLSDDQIKKIKEQIKIFLEKRAFAKDKRAIIQIAKLYEDFLDPPEFINAYKWYNIAVAIGIKSAKNKRDDMLNKLNEKDLLEAQNLSIKLFNKINN